MELVDLIVGIVVVTILVTVVVGLVTYVAYKLRLARQPDRGGRDADGTRYFFLHEPPADEGAATGEPEPGAASAGGDADEGERA